jgi:hypothetical protein
MGFSLGEKAHRTLRLLMGLRNPRIASALVAYGFDEADMNEGWALLKALGQSKLELLPDEPPGGDTLQALDAWENRWFPIARATLTHRYPEVHAKMFLNLTQTEGNEVAISVHALVSRYDALDDIGAQGTEAKELLKKRGLTPAVVDEARALLDSLGKIERVAPTPSAEQMKVELNRAEAALWNWYLEWSQVARVAIKQRVLLRQLGFGGGRAAGEQETTDGGTSGSRTISPRLV